MNARGFALMVFKVTVLLHTLNVSPKEAVGESFFRKRVVCMWERVRDVQMVQFHSWSLVISRASDTNDVTQSRVCASLRMTAARWTHGLTTHWPE